MPQLQYLPNVSTLKLDAEKCNGCGMCAIVCPHAVFAIEKRRARITDVDSCMECGACAENCPEEAIYVKSGVGCAYAVLAGRLRGTEADCGCGVEEESESSQSCCS
ncbi:MAG: 4Fe-4S binding protein [Candidatus Zixiibacteriota bacterium]|nr:MAG: 4Fe-4S binding protein [candidate division Zixibacteria bacterium]